MNKYGYVFAIAPFVLGIVIAEGLFKNSKNIQVSIGGVTLLWAIAVCAYSLSLIIRSAFFKCPQCHCRFGTDDECWSCAFPRMPKHKAR